MCPEFSYAKGRILPSVEFILKEMDDFDRHFSKISWNDYRVMDTLKAKAMEKTVENILTALIEIAGTIAVESEIIVESYSAALTEASLIIGLNEESAVALGKLAGMRNRLAHRYLDFKWETIKAYKGAKSLIKDFLKRVVSREKKKLAQDSN
jgi:uncharacterized protein YutE (UPF0331/DUF86 family)